MDHYGIKKIKAGAAGIASTTRGRARMFEDKDELDETQDLIKEGLEEYEEKKKLISKKPNQCKS